MELPLLHPAAVHFPVALFVFELLLLCFWIFSKQERYFEFALFTFRVAFFGCIAAIITGLIDTGGLEGVVGKVKPHFRFALILGGVQILRAIYWHLKMPKNKWILLMGALIGSLLVLMTAHEGGEIVYS